MILVGMREYDEEFNELLEVLNQRQDIIIIHENLSNLTLNDTVWNTDACLSVMNERRIKQFVPDVVITMGAQIVSKKLNSF